MYVLHYFPDTASLAPRMVLAELGVQHRCALIDREAGVLSSPAYRALHPLGQIPALETPDGPMFETAAILLYLADRHGGLAPAPQDPDRASFLSWFVFTNNGLHTAVLDLLHPYRAAGEAHARPVAEAAHARLRTLLTALDSMAATASANSGDHLVVSVWSKT